MSLPPGSWGVRLLSGGVGGHLRESQRRLPGHGAEGGQRGEGGGQEASAQAGTLLQGEEKKQIF